jgi:predicted transcriptional regulator
MAITTLKLSDELKARVAKLVDGTDKSAHAFMIEAIANETQRAELRRRFVADALAAEREVIRSGKTYAAEEVFAFVEAKAKGKRIRKPAARSWRRG